jgi:hypothetical protein
MNDRHLQILRAQLKGRRAVVGQHEHLREGDGALAAHRLGALVASVSRATGQLRQAEARRNNAPHRSDDGAPNDA